MDGEEWLYPMTPLDFFLRGIVNNNVYRTSIENIVELRRRIVIEVHSITKETLSDVFSNVLKTMNLCISNTYCDLI